MILDDQGAKDERRDETGLPEADLTEAQRRATAERIRARRSNRSEGK